MTKKTKAHPPVDNPVVITLQAPPEVVAEAPLKENQKVTLSGSLRTDN